jgi:acetate---CoA ligase (ADP-forming)
MPTLAPATVDVALRDGATVTVRPLVCADEAELSAFLDGLSVESRWLRFFSAGANLHSAAAYMAALDPEHGRGLVAVAGEPERIVAHAAYIRETADRAEVAFEVADEWQGRGIATLLLAHLSELATADGIETFTAVVLPENRRMIQVFRDSGFAVEVRSDPGELRVELPAALGDEARSRFEERDHVAAAAAVAHVLRPALARWALPCWETCAQRATAVVCASSIRGRPRSAASAHTRRSPKCRSPSSSP